MSKLYDEIGQFTTVPNWLIEMGGDLGADAMALVLALRYHSGVTGDIFPSYDTIQQHSGLTRRRIAAAIRKLEEYGLLVRKRRFSQSTMYYLKSKEDASQPPISTDAGLSISTPAGLPLVQGVHTNKTQLTRLTKIVVEDSAPPPIRPNIFGLYENTIGPLTVAITPHLLEAEKKYAPEWITAAFEQTALNRGRSWNYTKKILENWERNGFKADTRKPRGGGNGRKTLQEDMEALAAWVAEKEAEENGNG